MAGSDFHTKEDFNSNVKAALVDQQGGDGQYIKLGSFVGDVPTDAGEFANDAVLTKTDAAPGAPVLFVNNGTTAAPDFQGIVAGAGAETLTTLADNGDGTYTYTSEDGTTTTTKSLCEEAEALPEGAANAVSKYIAVTPETQQVTIDVVRPIPDEIQITLDGTDLSSICTALNTGLDFEFTIVDGPLAGTYSVPAASFLGWSIAGCPTSVAFSYSLSGGGTFPGATGNGTHDAVIPGGASTCELVDIVIPQTSASNGLSIDGGTGDVQLGGTLLKNTDVSGDNYTYNMSFGRVKDFAVVAERDISSGADMIRTFNTARIVASGEFDLVVPGVTNGAGSVLTLQDAGGTAQWAQPAAPVNLGTADLTQTDQDRIYNGDGNRSLTFNNVNEIKLQADPTGQIVLDASKVILDTTAIDAASANVGDVFTLVDDASGEGEWAPATGGVCPQPWFTSVTPATVNAGATEDIVIDGVYLDTVTAVTIPGMTVNTTTVDNPTQLTVNVTGAAGAQTHDIELTNVCGTTTATGVIDTAPAAGAWLDMRVPADFATAAWETTTGSSVAYDAVRGVTFTTPDSTWSKMAKAVGYTGDTNNDFEMVIFNQGALSVGMPGLSTPDIDTTTAWPGGNSFARNLLGYYRQSSTSSTLYGSQLGEGGSSWSQSFTSVSWTNNTYTKIKIFGGGKSGQTIEFWVSDANFNDVALQRSFTSNKVATPLDTSGNICFSVALGGAIGLMDYSVLGLKIS